VAIGKSVPHLISYLHEFFQNFSQSLAIYFELFSFGEIVYSEITDERAPPVRLCAPRRAGPARQRAVAAWAPRAAPTPRHKAAVGTAHRASRQPPRPRRSPPDSTPPRARRRRPDRLARAAVVLTASSPTVPPSRPKPRLSTLRRRSRAGEPLLLGRFPRTGVVPPRARRAAPPCATLADRAGPHALRRLRPSQAAPALCIWAERGFGPVAPS
jgi:hypothetical protein